MALSNVARSVRYGLTQPFRLHNTAMPAELVLIVRAMTIWILLFNELPFPVRVPIFEILDALPVMFWTYVRIYGLRFGLLLILFTPFIRVGSALVGSLFLLGLFGCMGCASGAHTYLSFIFIMSALSSHQSGKILFKIQTILVYFAAALNKGTEIGWWDGGYFEAMMFDRYQHPFYMEIAKIFPPNRLSMFMGIFVLLIEAMMVILLSRRIWVGYAMILGIFFHTSITVMMGITFGPFWVQIMLSYIAFIELPKQIDLSLSSKWYSDCCRKILKLFRAEHYYLIVDDEENTISISFDSKKYTNVTAVSFLLFTSMPIYYYLAIPFSGAMYGHTGRLIHIGIAFILLLPILITLIRHKLALWQQSDLLNRNLSLR